MKKCLKYLFLLFAIMFIGICCVMGKGWVEFAGSYFYQNDDGTFIKNGVTPDGKYVNEFGILVENQKNSTNTSATKLNIGNVGALVQFGNYYQDSLTVKEPIDWYVLDKNENSREALLISKYVLDAHKFNEDSKVETYKDSEIRKWLISDFFNSAFDDSDKSAIVSKTVVNTELDKNGADSGPDTVDKIFLLSINEWDKYYKSDYLKDIKSDLKHDTISVNKATKFAIRNAKDSNELKLVWLRSINKYKNAYYYASSFYNYSDTSSNNIFGVRPCIWVKY